LSAVAVERNMSRLFSGKLEGGHYVVLPPIVKKGYAFFYEVVSAGNR
jgi:hypothetical protein